MATSGLTLLARSREAAERFRKMLCDGEVTKRYRAKVVVLSEAEAAKAALLEHWLSDAVFGRPAPRLVAPLSAPVQDSRHKWRNARTTILSTTSVKDGSQEMLLDLDTGRTHQNSSAARINGCACCQRRPLQPHDQFPLARTVR